jgi:hypothetical protein
MQHGCEPAAKPKHQTSMCYMAPCTTEEWHNVLDAFEPRGGSRRAVAVGYRS